MALDYLRARGQHEVAALLERGRVEEVARTRPWQAAGRDVSAVQVALWLSAADRARLRNDPRSTEQLEEAIGAVVMAPDTLFGGLLLLVERVPAVPALLPTGGYREVASAAAGTGRPSGDVVAATAAAVLEAEGAPTLADALRRARVALEPVAGVAASHVTVALDPADLAELRSDPRARALVSEALELAGRTSVHRTADVSFTVRAAAEGGATGGERSAAEVELANAARHAGWAVVALRRGSEGTTLLLARDGVATLVQIDGSGGGGVREDTATVRRLTVSEEELGDDAKVLQVVARLGAG